jgi:hypothetical protein
MASVSMIVSFRRDPLRRNNDQGSDSVKSGRGRSVCGSCRGGRRGLISEQPMAVILPRGTVSIDDHPVDLAWRDNLPPEPSTASTSKVRRRPTSPADDRVVAMGRCFINGCRLCVQKSPTAQSIVEGSRRQLRLVGCRSCSLLSEGTSADRPAADRVVPVGGFPRGSQRHPTGMGAWGQSCGASGSGQPGGPRFRHWSISAGDRGGRPGCSQGRRRSR